MFCLPKTAWPPTLQNKTLWSSYTEIIDVKQCYPISSLRPSLLILLMKAPAVATGVLTDSSLGSVINSD